MGRFSEIDNKERELDRMFNSLLNHFKDYMSEVPDYGGLTRLSDRVNAYTISSKSMKGKAWDAYFFDSQVCVMYLVEYVNKSVSPKSFKQRVGIVLDTGVVKLGSSQHRMNEEVLKRLREFMES